MKITGLEIFTAGNSWRNVIVLRLTTDEGISGISEATEHNQTRAVLGYLEEVRNRYVIGTDPFDTEDLFARMFRQDYTYGGTVQTTVISAIEIACWDIVGKALGQPVWRLLGGKCRDRIPAYANGWYTGERTPMAFAEKAREAVARGYRGLKFDPFGAGGLELSREERRHSIALVEAVRDAAGPEVELFIEAHGRFSPATAIAVARELERFDPSWIEEPVPPEDLRALETVRSRINIPIATGERCFTRYGFRDLIASRAVDVLQPDVIHAGGFLETKKIAAMGEACFMTVAPHNSAGPLCTAASVHLAACTPNFRVQETFDDFTESWLLKALPGAPVIRDGAFDLPRAPGLGVELDEEILAQHPPQDEFFNLWQEGWHKRQFWRVGA